MNVSEIYQQCGLLLNDPNNERWSTSVLLKRMNLIQNEIQTYTDAVKTYRSFVLSNGSTSEILDTDVLKVLRVFTANAQGQQFRIKGINIFELDYLYPNWQNVGAGTPEVYYYDSSTRQIYFFPTTDADVTINMILSLVPNSLAALTDVPFTSNNQMIPYHLAIVHGTVALCFMDEATPESLAKSKFHRSNDMDRPGEYEKHIKRITAEFDSLKDVEPRILWKPTGGRLTRRTGSDRKSFV